MGMSEGSKNNNSYRSSLPDIRVLGALASGVVVACIMSYKTGKGVEMDNLMKLQNAKTIIHPYHGFNPKADISKENAEKYLLDMDKGEQFKYEGKIITLLKRNADKESTNTGFTDYFMVGNQINMINTSNLNAKTIDQVFGK